MNYNRYDNACLSKIDFDQDTCKKISSWVKHKKNMLFLSGNPGLGKTYLCYAVKNSLPKDFAVYYKETEFFAILRRLISSNQDYESKIDSIAGYNFLILDDVFTTQMTDWQQECLFSLIDKRYDNKLPLLVTSNYTLKQIKDLMGPRGAKFVSRLASNDNIIIEMLGLDRRTGADYGA